MSKATDIAELCKKIIDNDVKLGVVLDYPQLLTRELNHPESFDKTKYKEDIQMLIPYKGVIKEIHI